jgi:hypothetical protein
VLRVAGLALVLLCALIAVAPSVEKANAQACPYKSGLPSTSACKANPTPDSIPSQFSGSRMAASGCANDLNVAVASLYSYDDPSCHPAGSQVAGPGSRSLIFIGDAIDYLPPNWKRIVQKASDFHAGLYCDAAANALILAFRGSISLTAFTPNSIDDWIYTNLLQHLGERPLQYDAAQDVADQIKTLWNAGVFKGKCGSAQPLFFLTGHSKGGGEAQYAAVPEQLGAVVFNSDPVNPVIFTDWAVSPQAPLIARVIRSAMVCRGLSFPALRQYALYFATGKISDVRMVNDPLTKYLFPLCGNYLPHAPIEWLVNTRTCPNDGWLTGHQIETVVRELDACAPQPAPKIPPRRPSRRRPQHRSH